MLHHYITKYSEDDIRYVAAWLQLDIFNRSFCFWRIKIKI